MKRLGFVYGHFNICLHLSRISSDLLPSNKTNYRISYIKSLIQTKLKIYSVEVSIS